MKKATRIVVVPAVSFMVLVAFSAPAVQHYQCRVDAGVQGQECLCVGYQQSPM